MKIIKQNEELIEKELKEEIQEPNKNNYLTPSEIEELEKIIDDSFETSLNIDEVQKYCNIVEDIEKKEVKMTDNENALFKEVLLNGSKVNNLTNSVTMARINEHEHFVEIMKELHFLKKHYLKITGMIILIACFGSYVAGTQHSQIAPYVSKVYDVFTNFKNKGD